MPVFKIEKQITACRICNSLNLEKSIDFGKLALTGVFQNDGSTVPRASLQLLRCKDCGLVQLGHNYSQEILYGDSYGYESHLNNSMVMHLQQKARVLGRKHLAKVLNPIIVDIASNDGTFLSGYKLSNATLIGIDPLIDVVKDCYPENSIRIKEFFSSHAYFSKVSKKANLVTSLSVIYDLEDPVNFAKQVFEILEDNGVWHFEQSYLPMMFETNSYDTICHEHLLYLSLTNIKQIIESAGMHLVEASINGINGGSIAITAIKSKQIPIVSPFVEYLLNLENSTGIINGSRLNIFVSDFRKHCSDIKTLITSYKNLGYDIIAFGASTKGNVLLQVVGLDSSHIRAIGEVNHRKFGKQTPGSSIPIVDEANLLNLESELTLALVLPWHFRENLLPKFEEYLSQGGKLLFPLPRIEMVFT